MKVTFTINKEKVFEEVAKLKDVDRPKFVREYFEL